VVEHNLSVKRVFEFSDIKVFICRLIFPINCYLPSPYHLTLSPLGSQKRYPSHTQELVANRDIALRHQTWLRI
jgi:hypothetical protein